MKLNFLISTVLLFFTLNCFSQAEKIKQAHEKQASSNHPTAISNTHIQQNAITKVTVSNKVTLPDTILIRNGSRITKTKGIKK